MDSPRTTRVEHKQTNVRQVRRWYARLGYVIVSLCQSRLFYSHNEKFSIYLTGLHIDHVFDELHY